jgi:hypothetical protein
MGSGVEFDNTHAYSKLIRGTPWGQSSDSQVSKVPWCTCALNAEIAFNLFPRNP